MFFRNLIFGRLKFFFAALFLILAVLVSIGIYDSYRMYGTASWYGKRFSGRKTASGEIFDPKKLTAAHKRLALGTKVIVTNLENNRQVIVLINDRGPYIPGRIIDLSRAAAKRLRMVKSGLARVRIEVIKTVR